MPDWVCCTKCNSKFDTRPLERKQQFACPLCKEPNMVYLDAQGKETEETYPREPEYAA